MFVLIDTGSSVSLISEDFVKRIGLTQVLRENSQSVFVTNGESITFRP